MPTASSFLEALTVAAPYCIQIVLTGKGIQFADLPKNRKGPTAMLGGHPFDRLCHHHSIEHRWTQPNHSEQTATLRTCTAPSRMPPLRASHFFLWTAAI
jgi:hypothetical protein